jgi:eukaryotic-like serine/threonine-protein kinase
MTSTGAALWPLIAPDGKSLTYTRLGRHNGIYSLPLDRSGSASAIFEDKSKTEIRAASWSADGKWLAYTEGTGFFVRPMKNAGNTIQFAPPGFVLRAPEFSPDGKWIAYSSDESGTVEVYVQPFPGPGEKHRVSSSGGVTPGWSRNGRELYYMRPGRVATFFAVEVSTAGPFRAGVPRVL